ncbi:hypothetical protein BN946_scf184978.g4 [Trametes cinnabarina]|uniref:FAD-binding PCMH-type domain-containing protein n=1 Tax=Pycnoporus cinnabarinus TaxID=5643 RepID=A0A060SQY3_PYCCI|nr:hypothetical protein BN946_scf184978.g4 [Trametes cinnabarina]
MVLLSAVLLAQALSAAVSEPPSKWQVGRFTGVCESISQAVSSASSVYWPGSGEAYDADIFHYATSSSSQAACSVEPGKAEDIAMILGILAENKTPFAVKSGGHAMNPHFSSTSGVHISLSRFNEVTYNAEAKTAEIGAGLIWDDVYAALEPHAVNVVAPRMSRLLLLLKFTILKGGFNNFGIVTKFLLDTHPQPEVWGGSLTIAAEFFAEVNAATAQFSQTAVDPKAQIIASYGYAQGKLISSIMLFYDDPEPPKGTFDAYLVIPYLAKDVKTRSFLDLVRSAPSNGTQGLRGIYHTVSVIEYTDRVLNAIINETSFWGERLASGPAVMAYSSEPFLQTIFSHAAPNSSAYPPNRAIAPSPLSISYAWNDSSADEAMHSAARESAGQLTRVLSSEGQNVKDTALYGNYAIFGTPLERIYGSNLPRLRMLKAKYDPNGIMGLTGGWKF